SFGGYSRAGDRGRWEHRGRGHAECCGVRDRLRGGGKTSGWPYGPGAGADAFALAGSLARLAARDRAPRSTLDPLVNRRLAARARRCTDAGQLALAYPLSTGLHAVGALVVVSGWRTRLADPERWALRRFAPAAAAAIVAAHR